MDIEIDSLDLELDLHFDGRMTTASIKSENGLIGQGVAKCQATDNYDLRIGADLAVGRALADLGQKVAAQAERLVVTREQAEVVLSGQGFGL